jgi:hypothetical protein
MPSVGDHSARVRLLTRKGLDHMSPGQVGGVRQRLLSLCSAMQQSLRAQFEFTVQGPCGIWGQSYAGAPSRTAPMVKLP